ncbi:MAG TPA: flagellar basal body P-ring protein FlgI, partial [Planctomycetota bacterium]|nr:flagellar basal body P-ring protein FlgI [Planctomycetota bacterium]
GLGIVVGLAGTGDRANASKQMLANLSERLGVRASPRDLAADNAAAVLVTATLPPFAKRGQRLDVTVSTAGDAKSLFGGTLLLVPLEGPDGQVHAAAQGALSVGGFVFGGAGASAQRNHPTVGRVPNGALVEREVEAKVVGEDGAIRLSLRDPSFETATRMAAAIAARTGAETRALAGATVRVRVPEERLRTGDVVPVVADVLAAEVEPDGPARVVINERTGTIVAGERVEIATVAISHGNLTITVSESPLVSQPAPLSSGTTEVVPRTRVEASEKTGQVIVLKRSTTAGELAAALNALGVGPRDLIAILQALKRAGALRAELEVM